MDTGEFRSAIAYYLKSIHGIKDERFRVGLINDIFTIEEKTYIKNLVCKPYQITRDSYFQFVEMLHDSEKCHVCILAAETKKQIALTYVAQAVQNFMNS